MQDNKKVAKSAILINAYLINTMSPEVADMGFGKYLSFILAIITYNSLQSVF